MNTQKNIRIVLLLIGSIGLLMIYYYNLYENQILALRKMVNFPKGNLFSDSTSTVAKPNPHPGYVIYRPNCKMMAPEPWHPSLKKYYKSVISVYCSRIPPLTYIDQRDGFSNVLRMNEAAMNRYRGKANRTPKCFFRAIKKFTVTPHDNTFYKLSDYTEFIKQVQLPRDMEFIHVRCNRSQENKTVYENFHSVVPLLPEVVTKLRKQIKKPSILILGLDSFSKLNLRRTMPKTLAYLKEKNWIELKGYNKVGDNTFPNLMALLTGKSLAQLEKCWENPVKETDDCITLWSEYNRRGYVTLYAEDVPNMFTYSFNRTGFIQKPTDYYMRPFMVAAYNILRKKNLYGMPVCLGPVLAVDHVFDYSRRFLRAFNNASYFALLWLDSLTHSDVNPPRNLDMSVHRFLRDLSDLGTYENSFVFLMSDHGSRFGAIRESFVGFLEERLPFMFVWTPKWFRKRHPVEYGNLVVNENRLTSPYDVHVTLRKLMDEGKVVQPVSMACPKCGGLFEKQSLDRTCEEASIDVQWCMCSEFRNVSVNATAVKKIAEYVDSQVVSNTKAVILRTGVNPSLCKNWKFERVIRAHEIIPLRSEYPLGNASSVGMERRGDRETGSNTKIFIIIMEFKPGKTKFESIVQINETGGNDSFVMLEYPKRLDSFYFTSKCVEDPYLKHYCYCRNNYVLPPE